MRARWICVVAVAVYGLGPAGAAELTSVPPLSGAGIERGIALVRCAADTEGLFFVSRGAVLDVTTAATDVLVTTAHGLPSDAASVKRDCRVLVRGEAHVIHEVLHAGGNHSGPEHDWAILVTRRIAGDLHRWRVGRVTADWLASAVAQQASIQLVLRSADAPQTDCRLEATAPDTGVLVAHSCVTHPGMSGSPLVLGLALEHEPVLIAIHIGTQMRWAGTKLDFVSVARPLDAEVAAAIETAAAYTAVMPTGRRARSR